MTEEQNKKLDKLQYEFDRLEEKNEWTDEEQRVYIKALRFFILFPELDGFSYCVGDSEIKIRTEQEVSKHLKGITNQGIFIV